MEINITDLFNTIEPSNYSASIAELGKDAGKITWDNALSAAPDYRLLDTPEKLQAFRDWAGGFGAWDEFEREGWSEGEATALLIQFIAGDIREALSNDWEEWDWDAYERDTEKGITPGRLFKVDDEQIYYYIGD